MAQGTCHTRVGKAVSADVVSCVFDLLKCLLADGQSTMCDRGLLLTVVSSAMRALWCDSVISAIFGCTFK